jgi:hypothetical protein
MYCGYQEERVGIALNGLTPPHVVPTTGHDLDSQHHMLWSFFVLSERGWELIVHVANIGRLVDHYCLGELYMAYFVVNLIHNEIFKKNDIMFYLINHRWKKFEVEGG